MNHVPLTVTGNGLFIQASLNGSPRLVDVRLYQGTDASGVLIDAAGIPILDIPKRDEWIGRIEKQMGGKTVEALRPMVVELAAAVIADKAKNGSDADAPKKGQGRAIEFPEPEPWPEPVDLADVLGEMERLFGRFLVMPDGAATAVALWVVLTYCIEHVSLFPRLAILSATKRCGKTSFLRLLRWLCLRACPAANISQAVLYRVIEMYGVTLLLDEADQFLKGQPEIVGLLNAGHTRDTAFVLRCEGDDIVPRNFSVFTPLVIASIGKLPTPTLEDRSVIIHMERKRAGTAEVEDFPDDPDAVHDLCYPICRRVARWVADHGEEIRSAKPARPAGLHDRAKDNWRGLFALADLAGGKWPAKARTAALRLLGEADADDARESLLADLHGLFAADEGHDRLSSEEIVRSLVKMEERSYAEWGFKQREMTQNALARALKPFKIKPRMMRAGEGRGYHREDFEPVWHRYGIPTATTATSVDSQGVTPAHQPQSEDLTLRLENPVSPCDASPIAVGAVADTPVSKKVVV